MSSSAKQNRKSLRLLKSSRKGKKGEEQEEEIEETEKQKASRARTASSAERIEKYGEEDLMRVLLGEVPQLDLENELLRKPPLKRGGSFDAVFETHTTHNK